MVTMNELPYFSPIQAKVYIGEYWLDDVVAIDVRVEDEKTPHYGFRSRRFDGISHGRSLVSGTLVCLFRYPGYLTRVVEQLLSPGERGRLPPGIPITPATFPSDYIAAAKEAALKPDLRQLHDLAAKAREVWWGKTETRALRAPILQAELDKRFDLRVVYDPSGGLLVNTVEKLISDVLLGSESQQVSVASGDGDQSIYEVYQFIARDMSAR